MPSPRLASGGRIVAAALLAGLAWLLVFGAFSAYFDDGNASNFRHRDDAIITVSHARGLVDVGAVSVGASGARVEGFSAPLQFVAASGYFAVGGQDANWFLDAQVALGTVALGAGVFLVAYLGVPGRRVRSYLAMSALLAIPVFASFSFLGWQGSGMENSITNALVALALATLLLALRAPQWSWLAGVTVGLLSVTRTEFVVHAAPLLGVAVLLMAREHPRRVRALVALVAPVAAIWCGVLVARWWYFGSVLPNSGVAQRIDPAANVARWVAVALPLVAASVVLLWLRVRRRRLPRHGAWIVLTLGAVGSGLILVADPGPLDDARIRPALSTLGVWPWFAVVGLLFLLVRPKLRTVDILTLTLLATGLAHMLVFGPARLSDERVVSFVMVPMCCLVAALGLRVDHTVIAGLRSTTPIRIVGIGALAAFALFAVVAQDGVYEARPLCCDASGTAQRLLSVAADVQRASGVPVVRVAAPDLGALSFAKQVDVVDLGWLGDPVLTRVWQDAEDARDPALLVDYLNHYALPDVVEVHEAWVCQYASWLRSPEFTQAYVQTRVDPGTARWVAANCPENEGVPGGIWVRRGLIADDSGTTVGFQVQMGRDEARLSRALVAGRGMHALEAAVSACRPGRDRWRCQWVTRAVTRNLRAIDDAGNLGRVKRALASMPTAAYDLALVSARGRGDWYVDAVAALEHFEATRG